MTKRIKVEVGEASWLEGLGEKIELEGASLVVPPHAQDGSNFVEGAVVQFLAQFGANVGAGIIAAFLYDCMSSGKLRRVFVKGRACESPEDIESALLEDEEEAKGE